MMHALTKALTLSTNSSGMNSFYSLSFINILDIWDYHYLTKPINYLDADILNVNIFVITLHLILMTYNNLFVNVFLK